MNEFQGYSSSATATAPSESLGDSHLFDYDEIWLEPLPHPDPVDDSEAEANERFSQERLGRLREKRKVRDAQANSATGNPELDKVFQALSEVERVPFNPKASAKAGEPFTAIPELAPAGPQNRVLKPDEIRATKGIEVEEDPALAGILDAHVAGMPEAFQMQLLGVYGAAKQEGKPYNEAWRRFLAHRRDLVQGGEGWPEFPQSAPTEKFWTNYLDGLSDADAQSFRDFFDRAQRYGFEAQSLSPAGSPVATGELPSEVNARAARERALSSLPGSLGDKGRQAIQEQHQDRSLAAVYRRLDRAGLLGKGPLTPYESFIALREFERAKYPDGRPSKTLWSDVLLQGLTPAGAAVNVGAHFVNQELPEGTPDSVRTAITWGLAGAAAPGSLATKATAAGTIGGAAAAGEATAGLVGAPGLAGAIVGPILSPGMAALAKRQFLYVSNLPKFGNLTEQQVNEAVSRLPVDYTPDDIGRTVLIGDMMGTVSATPNSELLQITMENGIDVTVRRDSVTPMPGAGRRGTVVDEAVRLRNGGRGVVEDETPLTMTDESIQQMPLGPTRVHFTPLENTESIFKTGFRPTEAGPETLPGVYTTDPNNSRFAKQAQVYGENRFSFVGSKGPVQGAPRQGSSMFVEVPNGPVASEDDVIEVLRELGAGRDAKTVFGNRFSAENMTKAADVLKKKGFVGADWRDGTVYFEPASVKPKVSAVIPSPEAINPWEDFITFAKGVMNGDSRVLMTEPIAGGALPLPGLSKELNELATAVTNNALDTRMLQMALSKAARARSLPHTSLGAIYTLTKSALGMNPGLTRKSQPSFLAAANYDTFQQMQMAIRMSTLEKAVKEAFGKAFIEDPSAAHMWSQHLSQQPISKPTRLSGPGAPLTPPRWLGNLDRPDFPGKVSTPGPEFGTVQPKHPYLIGTLAHVIDNPSQYKLTPQQSQVIDLWQAVLRHDAKITESLGIDYNLIEREYIPYRMVEKQQTFAERLMSPKATGSGLGSRSRPFMLRERTHKTLDDWADFLAEHGEAVELNPFKLYLQRLNGTARLRADQVYLQGVAKVHGQPIPAGKTAPPGWTEIGVGRLKNRVAVPEDVAREVNLAMTPNPRGNITSIAEQTLQLARSSLLSMDLSFLTQQGYALAVTDPIRYMKRFGDAVIVGMSNEGFVLHLAQNLEGYSRWAQAGLTFFTTATDVVRTVGKKQMVDKVPVAGQLNEFGYGRFLPIMKTQQATGMLQMLTNLQQDKNLLGQVFAQTPFVGPKANEMLRKWAGVEGMSQDQLMEVAADTINNVGGGINWAKIWTQPNLASQMVFLTEGWLRANVGRIVQTAKVGDPAGVLARRWMMQNLATTSMLSTGMSLMLSGRLPNYDPTATDFLDIQVGPDDVAGQGGTIPILPGKTYIRTIFQSLLGRDVMEEGVTAPWEAGEAEDRVNSVFRFAEGRMGQGPRLAMDLVEGRDYLGRRIDDKTLYAAKSLMPIAMQYIMDGLGVGGSPKESVSFPGAGLAALGYNFIPRNPFDVRDNYIQSQDVREPISGEKVTRYSDMTDIQRSQFDREHPEFSERVRQWQEERDSPFVALRENRQRHRFAVEALGKAFQGEELTLEERNALGPEGANLDIQRQPQAYRRMLSSLAAYYSDKAKTLSLNTGEFAPTTPSQEVVQGYYKDVVEASRVAGGLDFALMDANERSYRRQVKEKYGEAGLRILDEELVFRVSDDPVAQSYHKDSTLWEPYFEHLDSFWTPDNLERAGFNREAAATAAKFPNREQYEAWLQASYIDTIYSEHRGVLPPNIANYRTSRTSDTIGEKFGIVPGRRLTEEQAQEVAEELVRIQLKNYRDRVGVASESYLKTHNEALCAMSYWDIIEPPEKVRPYLQLCPVRRP